MEENNFVAYLTKKDKVYISIIAVLVCVCIVLAIVLPRPYKVVKVETPVYETKYQQVYETEKAYLISSTSTLYNQSINGYNDGENLYVSSFAKEYLGTGNLKDIKVSVKVSEAGVDVLKTLTLNSTLSSAVVQNANINSFGIKVEITSQIMQIINSDFVNMLGEKKSNPLDYYLFEISFEKAIVNVVVAFISE